MLMLHLSLALANAAAPGYSATVEQRLPTTATQRSPPSGLAVVIANDPGEPMDLKSLSNPYIKGVALQIHWSDLEPEKGKPDWSRLDTLFAAAESSGKWVQLLVFPGFFSPEWALKGVKTEQFPIQYGPGKGTIETLPMPWDTRYLNRWFAFVKLLSDRYGSSPAFKVVSAVGPTSVSAEFTLPESPADIKKWQKDGYTPSKYTGAWNCSFQTYASDFPNQFISLSLGSGLRLNNQGKIDAREANQVRRTVVNEAESTLGNRFVLQESNLDGDPTTPTTPATLFMIRHIARAVTGFQLRTSCEKNSGNMGAMGDPALALRRSIDNGMTPNKAGQHVNYIEIYEPDIAAANLQQTLKYEASLFERYRVSFPLHLNGAGKFGLRTQQ